MHTWIADFDCLRQPQTFYWGRVVRTTIFLPFILHVLLLCPCGGHIHIFFFICFCDKRTRRLLGKPHSYTITCKPNNICKWYDLLKPENFLLLCKLKSWRKLAKFSLRKVFAIYSVKTNTQTRLLNKQKLLRPI